MEQSGSTFLKEFIQGNLKNYFIFYSKNDHPCCDVIISSMYRSDSQTWSTHWNKQTLSTFDFKASLIIDAKRKVKEHFWL